VVHQPLFGVENENKTAEKNSPAFHFWQYKRNINCMDGNPSHEIFNKHGTLLKILLVQWSTRCF